MNTYDFELNQVVYDKAGSKRRAAMLDVYPDEDHVGKAKKAKMEAEERVVEAKKQLESADNVLRGMEVVLDNWDHLADLHEKAAKQLSFRIAHDCIGAVPGDKIQGIKEEIIETPYTMGRVDMGIGKNAMGITEKVAGSVYHRASYYIACSTAYIARLVHPDAMHFLVSNTLNNKGVRDVWLVMFEHESERTQQFYTGKPKKGDIKEFKKAIEAKLGPEAAKCWDTWMRNPEKWVA